jgi:hypothetical protein
LLSKKTLFIVFLLGVVLVVVFVRLGWFSAVGGGEGQDFPRTVGSEIFYGKGRCGLCHTVGLERAGKCPSLQGAGSRLTADFIYEAMTAPSEYVRLDFSLVEPKEYPARMPAVNRLPIGLTEKEMQEVMMFVQGQEE